MQGLSPTTFKCITNRNFRSVLFTWTWSVHFQATFVALVTDWVYLSLTNVPRKMDRRGRQMRRQTGETGGPKDGVTDEDLHWRIRRQPGREAHLLTLLTHTPMRAREPTVPCVISLSGLLTWGVPTKILGGIKQSDNYHESQHSADQMKIHGETLSKL